MIQKIKTVILTIAMLMTVGAPTMVALPVYAATAPDIASNLCRGGSLDLNGNPDCTGSTFGTNNIQTLLSTVINWISIIVGVIAVIMIIIGGLRYITSGGDSGKVGSAKTTIIYALIGLVIVALAQLIVHFVLAQASTITSGAGA